MVLYFTVAKIFFLTGDSFQTMGGGTGPVGDKEEKKKRGRSSSSSSSSEDDRKGRSKDKTKDKKKRYYYPYYTELPERLD